LRQSEALKFVTRPVRYSVYGGLRATFEFNGTAIVSKTGVTTNLTFTGQEPDEETDYPPVSGKLPPELSV
jgi:hypothetical protein